MAAVRIALFCLCAAFLCAALRADKPEMARAVALAAGVGAFLLSLDDLRALVAAARALAEGAGLESGGFSLALRASGIALISEFAGALCRDAGESALAGRIEFGARAALLALSAPLLSGILKTLSELLP